MDTARTCAALLLCVAASGVWADDQAPTMASVLSASSAADWRQPDPANLLYLELASGRVIIELAPAFAPRHAANIRKLVHGDYFAGGQVLRVQENYVVQWGHAEDRPLPPGADARLPLEIRQPYSTGQSFTALPDGDVYAAEVGFSQGFPVARDPAGKQRWLAHCYAMVGVGRGMEADSGNGSSLYVVTGHAPRHLDLNITLAGRLLHGMEHLTTLPRGTGALGFYEQPEQRVAILSTHLAADLPAAARTQLEVMRTDTDSFRTLISARRHRHEAWFLDPVGRIGLCNMPVPVRILN